MPVSLLVGDAETFGGRGLLGVTRRNKRRNDNEKKTIGRVGNWIVYYDWQ